MKVSLTINPHNEEYANIHSHALDKELNRILTSLSQYHATDNNPGSINVNIQHETQPDIQESTNTEQQPSQRIMVRDGSGYQVLTISSIDIIRREHETVVAYTATGKYALTSPLYELEQRLGPEFCRISKSAIVNLNAVERLDTSFGASISVVMQHGVSEYISRRYFTHFKKALLR